MNVKQLRTLLEGLPDHMSVVAMARDHSYRNVSGYVDKAELLDGRKVVEYFDESCRSSQTSEIVKVLVIV